MKMKAFAKSGGLFYWHAEKNNEFLLVQITF